ncbi:hypothetical protein [Streptomyces sp. NPDC001537]
MASSGSKGGTALIVAGVVAVLFVHANTGGTGSDQDQCRSQLGITKVEAIKQEASGPHSPMNLCLDRREAARLSKGK